MKKTFGAFNLNVEKIGNIIPQLHIHIIARKKGWFMAAVSLGSKR
jgi:diadenosine tetraphosphate (Ap4A) HIT family hydrolase